MAEKRGALLNYTTTIDPSKSVGEIMGILVAHGARGITTLYDDRQVPCGIMFGIRVGEHDLGFRLPANVDACNAKLTRQYEQGKIERRFSSREQAARVAWRILKDWVEAQVALIETGMVRTEEVFLPYMLAPGPGERTMFQVMQERLFALPAPQGDRS